MGAIPAGYGSVTPYLLVDGSRVLLGESMGEFEPTPASLFLYVEDCDQTFVAAIAAGGARVMEVTDLTHAGERYGGVRDPSGNIWWVATRVEELSWEEQQERIDLVAAQAEDG